MSIQYADGVEARVGDYVICVDRTGMGLDSIFDSYSDVFEVRALYVERPYAEGKCDIRRVCDGKLSYNWFTSRFIRISSGVVTTQTRRLTVKSVRPE